MALTISVIVCAYNEARHLPACLFSLKAQTRPPDEIIVINNASTDGTADAAREVPGVRVIDEPTKGLVFAREAGRSASTGDVLAYVDADCRAPIQWLERIERHLVAWPAVVAVTGPYRFYDWDWSGRALIRLYDVTLAPLTHVVVHHLSGVGAILYGGNFAVRRTPLDRIGGFDCRIEFHGEDTNLGRRLTPHASEARRAGKLYDLLVIPGAEVTQNHLRSRKNSHIVALNPLEYISADQPAEDILKEIRRQGALSIACHPHHRTTRRIEISTCYLWDHRKRLVDLVDVWEAANRDDLFSVTSLKHYPYIANSDFHKPKHLYSWKTLLKCEKNWEAIARALRANVDIALTLFRNGSWAA